MVVENIPAFLLQNNKSQLYPHNEKCLLHLSLLHARCGLTLADLRLLWRHILKIVGQLPPPRSKPKNARVSGKPDFMSFLRIPILRFLSSWLVNSAIFICS